MKPEILTLAKVLFATSLLVYIFYAIYSARKEKIEESLFRSIRTIADSARIGEATESTIKRIADQRNEPSSNVFREILKRIEIGDSFADALKKVSASYNSYLLTNLSDILTLAQESGADIYEMMNLYSKKLYKLRSYSKYAKSSTVPDIFVIRIMGIIMLPIIFYFFPIILPEVFLPAWSYYFFAGFGAILALLDLFVYSNIIPTIINIPLFASIPILIPWVLDMLPIL